MTRPDALALITSLRAGQAVTLTQDGRAYRMTVVAGPDRSDGTHGSAESLGVVLALRPGGWACRVDVASLVSGRHELEAG
jgi:hypothetical protein